MIIVEDIDLESGITNKGHFELSTTSTDINFVLNTDNSKLKLRPRASNEIRSVEF